MTWLQVISGIIGLAAALVSYLQDRGKLDQAEATLIIRNLREEQNRVQKALDARRSVKPDADSLRRDPNNRVESRDRRYDV